MCRSLRVRRAFCMSGGCCVLAFPYLHQLSMWCLSIVLHIIWESEDVWWFFTEVLYSNVVVALEDIRPRIKFLQPICSCSYTNDVCFGGIFSCLSLCRRRRMRDRYISSQSNFYSFLTNQGQIGCVEESYFSYHFFVEDEMILIMMLLYLCFGLVAVWTFLIQRKI